MAEQITREEAIQFLTGQLDVVDEATTKAQFIALLRETGTKIGYAPTFRCLVMGLTPDESIRWGK